MYRLVLTLISAALSSLLPALPSHAEECPIEARQRALSSTLKELRHDSLPAEVQEMLNLPPDIMSLRSELRVPLQHYLRAVEQNPWAPPETVVWRALVINQARENPLPLSEVMVPVEPLRSTIKRLAAQASAFNPDRATQAQQLLARDQLSYQEYLEFCIGSLVEMDRRVPLSGRERQREILLRGFVDAPPSSAHRIPVYRDLTPRERLIGGGPSLISLTSRSGDYAEALERTLATVSDHSTASGELANINHRRQVSAIAGAGVRQFIDHESQLTLQQQQTNRFAQAVNELWTTDPDTAAFLEVWANEAFAANNVPVSFEALRQAMDNTNAFYGNTFRDAVFKHYRVNGITLFVGSSRWTTLRNHIQSWLSTHDP